MARTRNSRIKGILAFAILPLCLSMTGLPVFGAGLEIADGTTGYGEGSDIGSFDENGVTKVMEAAAELKAEEERVNSLKAGSDYIPSQGVFLADSEEEAEKVAKEYGAELLSFSYGVGVLDLGRDIDEALSDTAARLSTATPICHNSLFSICEETSNDPFLEKGSSFYQWQHEKIETLKAQEIASGNGITVAVIDTGINSGHTELKDRTISMVAVPYTDRNRITTAEDQHGHGSHCAGIVAAEKNNGTQGMGVAPGADIYAVKVTNGRTMPLSDVIIGVQMAVEKKVQVISISIGVQGVDNYSLPFEEVVDRAREQGITIVAAAGNSGTDVVTYPAAYDSVIAVAASDSSDSLGYYSNYGDWVDIVAPGTDIWSCFMNEKPAADANVGGTEPHLYAKKTGTSQATPVVAGVVALMYSANPWFKSAGNSEAVDAIRDILKETSDGNEYTYGGHSVTGQVMAYDAVKAAEELVTVDHSYSLVEKNGYYGAALRGVISKGKSIKLSIGNKSGDIRSAKAVAKSAVWASDNSMITVKKGKIKCNKNAKAGDTALITATVGGEELKYRVTVREAVKKTAWNGDTGKIFINVPEGMQASLVNPMALFGSLGLSGEPYAYYDKSMSEGSVYALDGSYQYILKMPKKGGIKVDTVQKNGYPKTATFSEDGRYKLKYKLLDGSNKTFMIILEVE